MTPQQRAAQRIELQRLLDTAVSSDRSTPHAYGSVVIGPFDPVAIMTTAGGTIPFPRDIPCGEPPASLIYRPNGVAMMAGEPPALAAFELFARDVADSGVALPGDGEIGPMAGFRPDERPYALVDRLVWLGKGERPVLALGVTICPYDPEEIWTRRRLNATIRAGAPDPDLLRHMQTIIARGIMPGTAMGLTLDQGLFFGMAKLLTDALAALDDGPSLASIGPSQN